MANYLSCRRLRIRLSVMKFQRNFLLWRSFTVHPRTKQHAKVFCYHPPTKLRKGNVFSHICVCLGRGDSHVTVTHDTLDLAAQRPLPPLDMGPYCTCPPCYWHLMAGDLFQLVHLRTPAHQSWHLIATEAQTVGREVVCILLECFLVCF